MFAPTQSEIEAAYAEGVAQGHDVIDHPLDNLATPIVEGLGNLASGFDAVQDARSAGYQAAVSGQA